MLFPPSSEFQKPLSGKCLLKEELFHVLYCLLSSYWLFFQLFSVFYEALDTTYFHCDIASAGTECYLHGESLEMVDRLEALGGEVLNAVLTAQTG